MDLVPERTIYITNLSELADERTLKELFNFCGHIVSVTIRKATNEANEALIEFENPSALEMALQFSNALVKGRAIQVHPFSKSPDAQQKMKMEEQARNEKLFKDVLKETEEIDLLSNPSNMLMNSSTFQQQKTSASFFSISPENSLPQNRQQQQQAETKGDSPECRLKALNIQENDENHSLEYSLNTSRITQTIEKKNEFSPLKDPHRNKNTNSKNVGFNDNYLSKLSSEIAPTPVLPQNSQADLMTTMLTNKIQCERTDCTTKSSSASQTTTLNCQNPAKAPPIDINKVVYLTEVCPTVSDDLFFEFFSFCGPIFRYSVNKELGQGLIEFKDTRAVKVALHLHNCILGNKKVKVQRFDTEKHKGPNIELLVSTLKEMKEGTESKEIINVLNSPPGTPLSANQDTKLETSNTTVTTIANTQMSSKKGLF
jgi:hypothetical protein